MRNVEADSKPRILIASSDSVYASTLANFIESDGCEVERCHDSKGVYRLIGRKIFEVLVLDLEVNEGADMEIVSFVRRQSPRTQIILTFEMADVEKAIEGIRNGAFFYVPKSSQPSDVVLIIHKAVKSLVSERTVDAYEQHLFQESFGDTPAMRRVVELVTKVSPTDSTVLLLGESGTGKEVLANMIHRLSPRRDNAFVAINCAALPEHLLESELFGHVKGAFTGAVADKRGLFEEADGGTIFLDEVGDTAPAVQAKLLRVLQNGEFRRVGESENRRVDARVLAATNLNLVEAVAEKTFREDLYFRLNVIQILIPPLRERLDALPVLAEQFLLRFNQKFSRDILHIDEHAWALLQGYAYPGNVRELESIIAHAVIMAEGDTIQAVDLPDQIRFGGSARLALPNLSPDSIPTLQEAEKRLIEMALGRLEGNQTEVAKKMGISRSTLWRKMKEYGIARSGVGGTVDSED